MRKIINFNESWYFSKMQPNMNKVDFKEMESVKLPHTWNNLDGQDGGSDYYRGDGYYYRKVVELSKTENKEAYIEFGGVSLAADVYVNGEHVFYHEGGFSTFRVDLTKYVGTEFDIIVKANNGENTYNYPQMADFTFFGGIYRDVKLVIVENTHFDLAYIGTPGYTLTPTVNGNNGDLKIVPYIVNGQENQTLEIKVFGQCGCVVATKSVPATTKEIDLIIENVHLWHGVDDPYLYHVSLAIIADGKLIDNVSNDIGFRTFHVDPNEGFFLNGKQYPLRGVSRHQDRLDKGWALTNKEHDEDVALIYELGANSIRLAHYQHNDYFYSLCDKLGLILWAEIPFISRFMPGEKARANTISQMKELVFQNYNHTSICFWGISNEITISGDSDELFDNLKELNKLTKEWDPTRLSTIANVSMESNDSRHNFITDTVGFNHYYGWYVGDVNDNREVFDSFHKDNPNVCYGISEYGAEGILKWHSTEPKVKDYSEEYHAYYHENMLQIFAERPYLWSTYVWNMFDFGCDGRDEGGVAGRNNKGLVTYDRGTKKDAYFIYQAYWSKKPMLHLCEKRFVYRHADAIRVKAYSNQDEVTLFVNGKSVGTLKGEHHIFKFNDVKLEPGDNIIVVRSNDLVDTCIFTKVDEEYKEYILESDGSTNVRNWFEDEEGNVVSYNFIEGYYSIQDKIGDIMSNPEAAKIVEGILSNMGSDGGIDLSRINPNMLKMIYGFSIQSLTMMTNGKLTPQILNSINETLNKIKK